MHQTQIDIAQERNQGKAMPLCKLYSVAVFCSYSLVPVRVSTICKTRAYWWCASSTN